MEQFEFEKIFKVEELKALRLCLSKRVFSHFIEEFAEVMRLQLVEKDEDEALVGEYAHFFQVTRSGTNWRCQCNYEDKCQLPCRHLLKVLIHYGSSIVSHLPRRWIGKESMNADKLSTKRHGRDKLSKRKVFS